MSFEQRLVTAIAALWAVGCTTPTEPLALPVSVQLVELRSESELRAWPFTPSIEGGTGVRVRGFGPFSCGSGVGAAVLRANRLTVTISPSLEPPICPAIYATWRPFEATVSLPPGSYQVRAIVTGQTGRAEFTVRVLGPQE